MVNFGTTWKILVGARGKFWHRVENVGMQVSAINRGVTRKNLCADAYAKFSIARCVHT
jgi:hypothetical protein